MANKFILFNVRLTADPELKGDEGKQKAHFRVADNYKRKGADVTDFYSVVFFKTDIGNHIGKGSKVTVEGNLSIEEKDGKIYRTIWADNVHIHTFKDKDQAKGGDDPPKSQGTQSVPF